MTSTPFWNLTPWTTLGNWFSPFDRRQVFAASATSLKTILFAVFCDSDPFVRTVRWRTVAETLSIGVEVAPRREVALLPGIVFRLPIRRQPRDHRRRQVGRVPAEENREGLREVAGRDAAQIKDRKQCIAALVRRAHFGRIEEVERIFSAGTTSPRSRTFARRTAQQARSRSGSPAPGHDRDDKAISSIQ